VLTRQGEGVYLLQDAGSSSGTWVNYAPVPVLATVKPLGTNPADISPGGATVGTLLENGDLIHIGRLPMIFELYKPTPSRVQVITIGDLE